LEDQKKSHQTGTLRNSNKERMKIYGNDSEYTDVITINYKLLEYKIY